MNLEDEGPWDDYVIRLDLQSMVGVDRACVVGNILLQMLVPSCRKKRLVYWSRIPRKIYVRRLDEIEAFCKSALLE